MRLVSSLFSTNRDGTALLFLLLGLNEQTTFKLYQSFLIVLVL